MRIYRITLVLGAAAVAVLALAGPAGADPKVPPGQTATLDCGDGPIPIAVAGNGKWTPAHALDSNTVYQPVAFGASTNTFEVLTGEYEGYVGTGPTDDPVAKNGARVGQGTLGCQFQIEGTFYEPNFDGLIHFESTGTVLVKVTHP